MTAVPVYNQAGFSRRREAARRKEAADMASQRNFMYRRADGTFRFVSWDPECLDRPNIIEDLRRQLEIRAAQDRREEETRQGNH